MIKYTKGDIFSSKTEAIINTVNCVGVMGKGLALQFKNKYPENFSHYKEACGKGMINVGTMFVFVNSKPNDFKFIVNFPTKKHWRYPSKLSWIEDGLNNLVLKIDEYRMKSISVPPLGCGNGGLNWVDVKKLIDKILGEIVEVEVVVFEP